MALLPKDPKDRQYLLLGLQIAGDFGATLAVPLVILVIAGQWLDTHIGHGTKFTVAAFAMAATISARLIYQKAKAYGKKYQQLEKLEKFKTPEKPKE